MKKSIQWILIVLFAFLTMNIEVKAAGSNSSIAGSGSGGGGADCWAHGCRTYGVAGIRVSIVNGNGRKIGTTKDYYGTDMGAQWNSATHYYVSTRSIKNGSHASVTTGTFSTITSGNKISSLPGNAPSLSGGYSGKSLGSINFSSVASYFNNLSTTFNRVAKNCKDPKACKTELKNTNMYTLLKNHGISDANATDCSYLKDVYILVEPISMVVIGNDSGTSGTNGSLAKYFIGTSTEIAYIIKNPSKVNAKATHVEDIAIGTIGGYITMPTTLEGFYLSPVSGSASASDLLNNSSGYGAGALYVWDKGIDCPPEPVYCTFNTRRTQINTVKDNKTDYTLCCDPENYEPGTETKESIESSKWFQESDQAASCRQKKVYCKLNIRGTALESIKDDKKDSTLCCDASNYESMTITELKKTTWYDENCAPKCDINNPSGKACCSLKAVDGTYNYKQSDLKKAFNTTSLSSITDAKFEKYLKDNHTSFYTSTCTSTVTITPCKVSLLKTYEKNGNLNCCDIVSKTGDDNYTKSDLESILNVVSSANFKEYLKKNFNDYYNQCYGKPAPEPNCELNQISTYLDKKDTSCCVYSEYDEDALKKAFAGSGILPSTVNQTNFDKFLSESSNDTYREFYELCNGGTGPGPNTNHKTCNFEVSKDCPNCDESSSKGTIGTNFTGTHDEKYCLVTGQLGGIEDYYGANNHKYCTIYCRITAEYSFPNKGFTIAAGEKFTLGGTGQFSPITINVKKECYTEIAYSQFMKDLNEKNEEYEDSYNNLQKQIKELETYLNKGASTTYNEKCGYLYNQKGFFADPKGKNHWVDYKGCKNVGFEAHWTKDCDWKDVGTGDFDEEGNEITKPTQVCGEPYVDYYTPKCSSEDKTAVPYFEGGKYEYEVLTNTIKNLNLYKEGKIGKGEAKLQCIPTSNTVDQQTKKYEETLEKAKESLEKLKVTNPVGEIISARLSCENWTKDASFGLGDIDPTISFYTDGGLNYGYTGNLTKFTGVDTQTVQYYEISAEYMRDPSEYAQYLFGTGRSSFDAQGYMLRPTAGGNGETKWDYANNLIKNGAISATFERNYTFFLPNNLYNYVDKITAIPSHDKPNGNNYVTIGYGNIPIALDQELGEYELSLTLEGFGQYETVLNNYMKQNKGCGYEDNCPITIVQDIQTDVPDPGGNRSYLNVVYRPISLTNPFVIQDLNRNNKGTTGANWCSNEDCSPTNATVNKYITKNRGTTEDKVYEKEPMYRIVLNAARILEIRKYNNTTSYDDFNLTCDSETGEECRSTFVRNSSYSSYFDSTCGTGLWNACDTSDGITR